MSSLAAIANSVSLISVDLPEPDTPVTQVNRPAGTARSTSLRLLPVAPRRWNVVFGSGLWRLAGISMLLLAAEVLAGQRTRRLEHVVELALRDDLAAVHAGARADVDDVVGQADRVLVVLDHDHGVAEVAQAGEGAEQAFVVALVQADRGLVEHVHHADQARADLRGQADALRFAAGQRIGLAFQREVIEADIDQEAQAVGDLLDDLDRDLAAPAGQVEALEEGRAPRRSAAPRSAAAASRRRTRCARRG